MFVISSRFLVKPFWVILLCLCLHFALNLYISISLGSDLRDFLYAVLHYGLGLSLILYLAEVLRRRQESFFANAGAVFLLANSIYFSISSMKYHSLPRYEDFLSSSDVRFLGALLCFLAIFLGIFVLGRLQLDRNRLFRQLHTSSFRSRIFSTLIICLFAGKLFDYVGLSGPYVNLVLEIISRYAFLGLWIWVGYKLVSGWGLRNPAASLVFMLLAFMTFDRLLDSGSRYILFSTGLAFFSGLSIAWLRTGVAVICYLTAALQLGSVLYMERVTALVKGYTGPLIGTLENNVTMLSYRSNLSDLGLNILDGSKLFVVRWDVIQETLVSALPRALKPDGFSSRVYEMNLAYHEAGLYANDYPDTVFGTGIIMFGFFGGLFSFVVIVLLLQWSQRILLNFRFANAGFLGSLLVFAGAGLFIELSPQQIGIKLRNDFVAVVFFATVYSLISFVLVKRVRVY